MTDRDRTAGRDLERTLKWVARAIWAALLVGSIGILVSSGTSLHQHGQMTERASGVIVGLVDAPDYHHTSYFYPQVELTTASGPVRFVGGMEKPEGTYSVGDTVEVIYSPDDPSLAELASAGAFGQHATATAIGALMLLVVLWLGLRAVRRGKSERAS